MAKAAAGWAIYSPGNRLRPGLGPRHDSGKFPDEDVEEGNLRFSDFHWPLLSIPLDLADDADRVKLERLRPYLFKLSAVSPASSAGCSGTYHPAKH